ncbi:hypothetical protein IC608_08930 [Devosia sp. PTR5]|uniref:Beta/gamma crystallin 'Greek key' domain-containing protein n=1 Tax=Devosia oryzisoli TaxID=2774138 RepID=A0A927ITA4_9HYPH|nr:hypothetical protein [Devosia oryzisoli]MBD8065598.1 hypothetical protein [Devosia oryzisoli]
MMPRRVLAAALILATVPALPVQALQYCTDGRPGLNFSFGFSFGGRMTENDRNEFDLMQLQRLGVAATRVERWNGCIRAFVRKPGGGEEMQYFDPNSYARLQ